MGFDCKDCYKGKMKWVWFVVVVVVGLAAVGTWISTMSGSDDLTKPVLKSKTCVTLNKDSSLADVKKHKKCSKENAKLLKEFNEEMKDYMEARGEADKYIA